VLPSSANVELVAHLGQLEVRDLSPVVEHTVHFTSRKDFAINVDELVAFR